MRSIAVVIAAISIVIGTPALAADMALKAPPRPQTAPVYSWTGFYLGADAGYTWNKVGIFDPAAPLSGTATANPNSGTFGGHVGYLYEFKRPVVFGIEADASWLNGSGNGAFPGTPINGLLATSRWDTSVRGVAGFAVDRVLLYGTGGWSWLGGSACGVAVFPAVLSCAAGSSGPSTVNGWIAGAGVAYAFTDNLIGRIEYLHADYGHFAYTAPGALGGSLNLTNTTDTFRVGLSWKFSGLFWAK